MNGVCHKKNTETSTWYIVMKFLNFTGAVHDRWQ